MLSRKNKIPREVINFTPPRLYEDKDDVYVAFYARDPLTGKMKKKRYMLNRYKNRRERDYMASQIIANIYNKIEAGWNPWVDADTLKGFQPISEVLDLYAAWLYNRKNKKLIRPKTYLDYKNRLKRITEYINSRTVPIRFAYHIDEYWCNEFLEYILFDRDDTPRTRNNYRTWLYTFCAWMVQKKYIVDNPVDNVPVIPEGMKERQPLEHSELAMLGKYLKRSNKYFYLACLMEYYTLIRPIELVRIRLRDISIKNQSLFISGAISKNKKDSVVAINDKIIRVMADLQIFKHSSDCFLFGKEMMPSDKSADSRIFRKEFAKVREILGFPSCYKFYSLKDSGIRDLMNDQDGGVVIARDQARHSSVEVTNLYAQGRNKPVHDEAKHFKGKL